MPKVKLYSKTWRDREKLVMSRFAPAIKICPKCGSPVADGYCCEFCGIDPTLFKKE